MSDLQIDFEWPIARYEFRPATAEEIAKQLKLFPEKAKEIPEAERPTHFGYLVRKTKPRMSRPSAEAMEKSVSALVEVRQKPFHEVAVRVANAVGTLFHHERRREEPVFYFRILASHLREIFEGKAFLTPQNRFEHATIGGGLRGVARIGVFLLLGPDRKPVLALQPENLQEALALYAARMVATGTTFIVCKNCKAPFLSGGTRGNKRRGDSQFCGDKCRYTYHNEMKRKAKGS